MARRAEVINLTSAANGKLGGRPVGAKSKRGRPKKAPAKVSRLNSKLDVLEFLASVYQDESLPTEVRIRAAIAFASSGNDANVQIRISREQVLFQSRR